MFVEDEGSDMEVDEMSDTENELGQEKKVYITIYMLLYIILQYNMIIFFILFMVFLWPL